MNAAQIFENQVAVPGGIVWYKVIGNGSAIPLLVLHGGPGLGHDYLAPLSALAEHRPVIFFDQLGSGKSDNPVDPRLWQIDRFVEEVDAVRLATGYERTHVLGHSWGGWLAIEYALSKPDSISKLVLASTSASIRDLTTEISRLKASLNQEVIGTLNRHAANRDYSSEEYQEALMEFFHRFICRLDPWPTELVRSLESYARSNAPGEMLGPDFFAPSGSFSNWNRKKDLRQIQVKTLITCGEYDEMGPACAQALDEGIPNSEVRIFEQCSHVPHLENPDAYMAKLREFLS